MGWTKYGLLAALLVVMFTVSVIGGFAGYSVEGVPKGFRVQAQEAEAEVGFSLGALFNPWHEYWDDDADDPGGMDIVKEAIGFVWHMTWFQVDGMPEFISLVFVLMGLLSLFLIVVVIRGN